MIRQRMIYNILHVDFRKSFSLKNIVYNNIFFLRFNDFYLKSLSFSKIEINIMPCLFHLERFVDDRL